MKVLAYVLSTFAFISLTLALPARLATPEENKSVWQTGAAAKVVFHVVGDHGESISNVMIRVFFVQHWNSKWEDGGGRTDDRGYLVSSGLRSSGHVIWRIDEDGYYKSAGDYWIFDMPGGGLKDGKWLPYGATNTVTLKRIRHPIPMFAWGRPDHALRYPATNTVMGFDLKMRDWCPPFGKGQYDDLQMRYEERHGQNDYRITFARLIMTMTNGLDGAYLMRKDMFSQFWSVYAADPKSDYQKRFIFSSDADRGQGPACLAVKDDEYLVFRTRTKQDKDGRLVEAIYGKIYGPINYMRRLSFQFYFNPTVNDTNLEYDPKGDLFYDGDWRHRTNYAP